MGPRAWSLSVEMPISAPKPNSPPSVKRVLAFRRSPVSEVERFAVSELETFGGGVLLSPA